MVFGTALLLYFLGNPVVGAWAANPQTRLSAPPAVLWIFTADYEDAAGQEYWIVAVDDAAQTHECRVTRTQADIIVRAAEEPVDRLSMTPVLRLCFEPSIRLQRISVEATRVNVDWAQWRLNEPIRTSLMNPLPADALP